MPDLDVEFASVDANDRGVTTKAPLALRESPDGKQRTVTLINFDGEDQVISVSEREFSGITFSLENGSVVWH